MDRQTVEQMGIEMTSFLGMENKKVVLFWKAFEENRFLACKLHYDCWKRL